MEMDMLSAFDATIQRAEERGMRRAYDEPGFGLDHLRDMRSRITSDFSDAKLGRWLGWAQASVVAVGCGTLEEMKAINLAHRAEAPNDRL